jgi:hypothetical protein
MEGDEIASKEENYQSDYQSWLLETRTREALCNG